MVDENRKREVTYDASTPEDVLIIDDVLNENRNETWKENKWYKVPFDSLVCVRTEGQTVYSHAHLKGLIYFNGTTTQRGVIYSSAIYQKGPGGEYWQKGMHSFDFPVLKGEQFMVRKPTGSPKPDWMDIHIQVIPYPRPDNIS